MAVWVIPAEWQMNRHSWATICTGAMTIEGESQAWVRHRLRISPFMSAWKLVSKVSAMAVGRRIM